MVLSKYVLILNSVFCITTAFKLPSNSLNTKLWMNLLCLRYRCLCFRVRSSGVCTMRSPMRRRQASWRVFCSRWPTTPRNSRSCRRALISLCTSCASASSVIACAVSILNHSPQILAEVTFKWHLLGYICRIWRIKIPKSIESNKL